MPESQSNRSSKASRPDAFFQKEVTQNKFRTGVLFFEPEKQPSNRQLSPAFHHEFTIKKPRSATRFCQNPQQNRLNSPQKKNKIRDQSK